MGSNNVDMLSVLRTKSQIDCDSLDIALSKELGSFADSTSNQADAYLELLLPHRADLLAEALVLAEEWSKDYEDVGFVELAVEIAMVKLALAIAAYITEAVHVMTNPKLTSTDAIVKNAKRIAALMSRISPEFPSARLCVKVVSTWEGLQACRELSDLGIQTLATTLFTMPQATLAAECGCTYISPFVHELKAFFDESYDDGGANLALCLEAQEYYRQNSYQTRVKAAGLLSIQEAKTLAGVDSMTIAPDLLRTLAASEAVVDDIEHVSLFTGKRRVLDEEQLQRQLYVQNEKGWREAYARAYDGKGQWKTNEAIGIFREYQTNAEKLMMDKRAK